MRLEVLISLILTLQKESSINDDLLQMPFRDSYKTLSTKTLEILRWYLECCDHVPYLLKTDDDMYINVRDTNLPQPPTKVAVRAVISLVTHLSLISNLQRI